MLEREFGPEAAQGYESYVAQESNNQISTMPVEALAPNLNFAAGVDYMNQVMSYERMVYFGHLQETHGLITAEKLNPSL